MSNKNFEDKVLKALWNIETDFTNLNKKIDNLDTKIDKVESNLNTKITNLDLKVDKVESNLNKKITNLDLKVDKLDTKIDRQTYELKQEMSMHSAYLNQAFEYINNVDKKDFMKKNNIKYSYT